MLSLKALRPLPPLRVPTSHGRIAVSQSTGSHQPIVLVHGNSMSRRVFRLQLGSALAQHYRVIAIDLPGHGESDDAPDPLRSYTIPGYADAVAQTLAELGISGAVAYGWSLGGHVVLDLMSRSGLLAGAMISGAPPAEAGLPGLARAFQNNPAFALVGKENLSADEQQDLLHVLLGNAADGELREDMARADGRGRRILFENIAAGLVADQRMIVESTTIPLAIVDGEFEPFASADYIATLDRSRLWQRSHIKVAGAGHAPFLQDAGAFNRILLDFMRDVARTQSRAARRAAGGALQHA